MNRFLDRHGILDADYERAAKDDPRYAALLRPDRVPTPLAGDALVIVDSSQPAPAIVQQSAPAEPPNEKPARPPPMSVSHMYPAGGG
jgi:hypothetical protein